MDGSLHKAMVQGIFTDDYHICNTRCLSTCTKAVGNLVAEQKETKSVGN